MKKILNYIILGVFITAAYSCDEDATSNSTNYLTFANATESTTVDFGAGSGSVDVVVYSGNKTGSDRTFNIMVNADDTTADPSAYAVPSSVTIPGDTNEGVFTVVINEAGLPADFSARSIVIEFMPNQGIFTSVDTDTVIVNAALVCPTANDVTIDVVTDNWPDETSWTLVDGAGAMVASGGPYNNPADDFTTISTDLSLPAGSYTMTLFDSYGDGGSSFTVVNGCTQSYASGATPDAGGGYPVVTSVGGSFTLD